MLKKLFFLGSFPLFMQISFAAPSLEEQCSSDTLSIMNSVKTLSEYSKDNVKVKVMSSISSKACWELGKKEKGTLASNFPRNSGQEIRPWEVYWNIGNRDVQVVYFTYIEDRPQMLVTIGSETKNISVYCEGLSESSIESLVVSKECRRAIKKYILSSDKLIEKEFVPYIRK